MRAALRGPERALITAACGYECAALLTGRAPTITALCRRHRGVELVLLALIIAHLHHRAEEAAP